MKKLLTLSILTLFLFFNKSIIAHSAKLPLNKNSTSIQEKFKYEELLTLINKLYLDNIYNNSLNDRSNNDDNMKNNIDFNLSTIDTTGVKKIIPVETTAYTGGCLTYTETVPHRNPNGISTIAVDPSVIPLGSLVYVDGYGTALASDTGELIKGNTVDLYLNSEEECINYGIQNVNLYLLAYPGQW